MFKKIILILSTFIFFNSVNAQFRIGKGDNLGSPPRENSEEEMALLKSATTIFTIPNKDSAIIEKYKEQIAEVWKITPFEVITLNKITQYSNKPNYAFATIGAVELSVNYSRNSSFGPNGYRPGVQVPTVAQIFLFYEIWMPVPQKYANIKERYIFARILLQPDLKTQFSLANKKFDEITFGRIRFGTGPLANIFETNSLYNFGCGYLKGYLKFVNEGLSRPDENISNRKRREQKEALEEENDRRIQSLKSDTLYVPKYAKAFWYIAQPLEKNLLKTIEVQEKQMENTEEDAKDNYPFTVKYVSSEELNNLILNSPKPILYLLNFYNMSGAFSNMYESKSGRLIYKEKGSYLFDGASSHKYFLKYIAKKIK